MDMMHSILVQYIMSFSPPRANRPPVHRGEITMIDIK